MLHGFVFGANELERALLVVEGEKENETQKRRERKRRETKKRGVRVKKKRQQERETAEMPLEVPFALENFSAS